MNTQTKSTVTHRTAITEEAKRDDGGRALLMEAFDFIRKERQPGKLTAQIGVGGSISALFFEETSIIPQKDITVVWE